MNTKDKKFNGNKKVNWKSAGVIAIIICLFISIIGIIFASFSFTKTSKNKQSKDFGDQLRLKYSLLLNQNKSTDYNADNKDVEQASTALYNNLTSNNLSEFSIDYNVQESQPEKDIAPYKYGNIFLTVNTNDPFFNYNNATAWSNVNSKDLSKDFDYTASIRQQIDTFYKVCNNYNLRLVEYNKSNSNPNIDFNTPNIPLVTDTSEISTNGFKISLPKPVKPNKPTVSGKENVNYWNLSNFQKEFIKNFNTQWTSEKDTIFTHDEVVQKWNETNSDDTTGTLPAPTNTQLIWINRAKLITELQLSYIAVYLYDASNNNMIGSDPVGIKIAKNMINTLTPYEKDIGYYLFKNRTVPTSINNETPLQLLSNALSFESSNNVEWSKDPLIELLKGYYSTAEISVPPTDDTVATTDDKTTLKEYKEKNFKSSDNRLGIPRFLFSWNLNDNPLISKTFVSIDYYNFFNLYQDTTNDFLPSDLQDETKVNEDPALKTRKKDFIANNYYSDAITPDLSYLTANGYNSTDIAKLLKSAKTDFNYFSSPLTNVAAIKEKPNLDAVNVSAVVGFTKQFLDSYNIVKTKQSVSLTGAPTYLSTFLAIIVLILLVGIIVSILYRIPGLIATIISLLSFTISSLFYIGLGTPFSFNTFLSLSVFSLLSFVPNIMMLDYFKIGIKTHLNLYNSFVFAIKKYARLSIGYHLTALIIGLSFLFFGKYQLVSFGSILVAASFVSILFNSIIYCLLLWLFIYVAENRMKLFLTKEYVDLLIEFNKTNFSYTGSKNILLISNKVTQNVSKNCFFEQVKNNWVFILSLILFCILIVAIVILIVFGFGFSSDFNNTSSLFIKSQQQLTTDQITQLTKPFNAYIYSIVETSHDNGHEYFIVLSKYLDPQVFHTVLADPIEHKYLKLVQSMGIPGLTTQNDLFNNIQILFNNPTPELALKQTLIICIFIAIAFLLVWSLIWLGFANMLMYFLILLFNLFVIAGTIGITRIPFDTNSLMSAAEVFLFFALMNFIMFADYKLNINLKQVFEKEDIKSAIRYQNEKNLPLFILFSLGFAVINLLFIIPLNNIYIYPMVLAFVATIVIAITNIVLISNLIYVGLLFKRLFIKHNGEKLIHKYLIKAQPNTKRRPKDFDKLDEQEIFGINRFI